MGSKAGRGPVAIVAAATVQVASRPSVSSELPADIPLSEAETEAIRLAMIVAGQFAAVLEGATTGKAGTKIDLSAVEALLREALVTSSELYGVRAAQIWADGFRIPEDARQADAQLFAQCNMDFAHLCRAKRAAKKADRLNPLRVMRVVDKSRLTNPRDHGRLLCISRGVRIQTPKDFVARSIPPRQRNKYVDHVSHAVNLLLYEQWLAGTVLLLPTEMVMNIVGAHFSYQHWALKANKACGRCICDTSNDAEGVCPLNGMGEEGKEHERSRLKRQWGAIVHPTLQDLVMMVLRIFDKHGSHNVVLWKMDLAAAFNLLNFHPDSAKLLAFELTEGMSVVHTTGMFGWVGTPYVFQVVTRVLADLCRPLLHGSMLWYVDDGMGISLASKVADDMATVAATTRSLLGSESIAEKKSESGRQMVFIGWLFDLDSRTVSMSERNMHKTICAFFTVDVKAATLSQVEKMASYASRYAVLCRQMLPYTGALYGCISSFGGCHNSVRSLSSEAVCDVHMWRGFLVLLGLDAAKYARPLESFRPRRPSVLIEYDASLRGFGVGVSVKPPWADEYTLVAYTRLVIPYLVTDDSSFQNTCEFIAVLLGLLLIKQTGCVAPGFAYDLVGDNVTSLSWVRRGYTASVLARRANVGFSLVAVDLDATLAETRHIAGELNVVYDGLSRGKSGTDVGLPAELYVPLSLECLAVRYVVLCDPSVPTAEVFDHLQLSNQFVSLLRGVEPSC